jgi:dTDP-4-amino-4,6-dideoxygalactose transaminase
MDVSGQQREIAKEATGLLRDMTRSGGFVDGLEVAAFEREYAALCEARHAVAVGSGTAALHLSLLAMGVGRGDEVILPANTFVAAAEAVLHAGGTVILADVEADTFNLGPAEVRRLLTPRTRAVIPVHLFGRPVDLGGIRAALSGTRVRVLEDACQAHGARQAGRRVGAIGDMGAFSFYPSKNLGAWGQGGMVTTDDGALAEEVRMLRAHGERRRYVHERVGLNERMDSLQAGVLRLKLRRLDGWNERRRTIADRYRELLADGPSILPTEPVGDEHVYHHFVIRVGDRDAVRARLAEDGIGTGIHYPIPLHLQPGLADLGHRAGDFPITEQLAEQILSLPMHPHLDDVDVTRVADAVLRHGASPE